MSEDFDEILADLTRTRKSKRPQMEIYSDFRQLFLGSDLGRRVLREILLEGHMVDGPAVAPTQAHDFSPNKTFHRLGAHYLALKILRFVYYEASQGPEKQASREPKGE